MLYLLMKKYKALILDLDGTVIPNRRDAAPSPKVINAINKAQSHIFVSVATGRPYILCSDIFTTLSLSDPCIVDGGSQIFDPKNKKILYEQKISVDSIKETIMILRSLPFNHVIVNSDEVLYTTIEAVTNETGMVCLFAATEQETSLIVNALQAVPTIAIHTAQSWKTGLTDIHITHALASKKHATEELLKIFHLTKDEVIGVGDSNNDLPIFQAVGLKVAMGNATDTLKQQADYIAPPVEKDGVAEIIEKFILR